MNVTSVLLALLLAAARSAPAHAQDGAGRPDVYVMTMSPGETPWERFGHNALCVRDPVTGEGVAFNWGVFSFDDPVGFVGKFLVGDLRYWVEAYDADGTADAYLAAGRTVTLQYLDLTPDQHRDLRAALAHAIRDENKFYDYDYYLNNCSTRVRDALDAAAGGQLRPQLEAVGDRGTYRWHTRRLSADAPYLYTALHAVMGQPIDRPINAWEESFLPERLRDHLRTARVTRPDGTTVPLVRAERTLTPRVPGPTARVAPPDWTAWYLLVGLAIGAGMVLTGRRARDAQGASSHRRDGRLTDHATAGSSAPFSGSNHAPRRRAARWAFAALSVSWCLVAGLTGAVGLWGWLATRHWVARYNENLLQFNPLLLGLVVLAPLPVAGSRQRGRRAARGLAVVILTCSLLGLVVQVLPWFDQANREMLALAVPVNVALAIAVLRGTRTVVATGTPDLHGR